MGNLQLPKEVDNLSFPQKVIAGFLAIGALYLLYIFLPPLVVILQNLWIAIALAAPLVFVAFNPTLVWFTFKTLSAKLTNWVIGLDTLSVMDRYLEWVKGKHRDIQKARVNIDASLEGLKNQITQKQESYNNLMKRAQFLNSNGDTIEAEVTASNALSDKEFIESLIPTRDMVIEKANYLKQLDEVFGSNTKQLAYKIDNLKAQYKAIKDTYKGMAAADDVIGGATSAKAMFDESVKQTNEQMNRMTANIKMFENRVAPMLKDAKVDQQLRQEEARKLLESFKESNRQLVNR